MLFARIATAPLFGAQWDMNRMIESSFARAQIRQTEWMPAVDIRETDTALTFTAELPGIKVEDLEVTADEGVLTIQGTKTEERKEGEEGRYHLTERGYGAFVRRFQLPQGVDGDKIEAVVADGMLSVRVPKTALPQPKRIQIQANGSASNHAPRVLASGESRKESPKKPVGAK